jgi:hypothetical protein
MRPAAGCRTIPLCSGCTQRPARKRPQLAHCPALLCGGQPHPAPFATWGTTLATRGHAAGSHQAAAAPPDSWQAQGTNPSPPPQLPNLDLVLHTLNYRFFISYGSASSWVAWMPRTDHFTLLKGTTTVCLLQVSVLTWSPPTSSFPSRQYTGGALWQRLSTQPGAADAAGLARASRASSATADLVALQRGLPPRHRAATMVLVVVDVRPRLHAPPVSSSGSLLPCLLCTLWCVHTCAMWWYHLIKN